MAEGGADPIVIMNTWTEELLYLMVAKLAERKEREAAIMRGDGGVADATQGAVRLPGVTYSDERD